MMAKVFVSYKYMDSQVKPLPNLVETRVRDYVNVLQTLLEENHHINKGELDGEDLSEFKDETIESKLRDRIYDSSVTLVLVSKGMKDTAMAEDDQWIPWEIAFSLRESTRDGRTSGTNAMIAVVLPDETGSYGHFVEAICLKGCRRWYQNNYFGILGSNMFNRKEHRLGSCDAHRNDEKMHVGDDHSFIYPVTWASFVNNVNGHLDKALAIKDNIDEYELQKVVTLVKEAA
jgi:hypothetical protein